MEIHNLIAEVQELVADAVMSEQAMNNDGAASSLVKLRELLNAQPELEAGGSGESPWTPDLFASQ